MDAATLAADIAAQIALLPHGDMRYSPVETPPGSGNYVVSGYNAGSDLDPAAAWLAIATAIINDVLGGGLGNKAFTPQLDSWTSTGAARNIATYTPDDGESGTLLVAVVARRTTGGNAVWGRVDQVVYRRAGASLPDFARSQVSSGNGTFTPTLTEVASGASVVVQLTAANNDVIATTVTMAITKTPG